MEKVEIKEIINDTPSTQRTQDLSWKNPIQAMMKHKWAQTPHARQCTPKAYYSLDQGCCNN